MPPRCERCPCVIAIRFRSSGLFPSLPDRLEDEPAVALEQCVHERELATVVDQEGVDVPALPVAETVDAGRDLGHVARARALPRRERVRNTLERRLELGEVPQEQRPHRVVLDPVDPLLRVHLGPEVVREEAVRLEPPRRHEDEDSEGGVAEAEPFGLPLGIHPDHRVDLLRVLVDPAQVLGVLRRVRHLLEGVVRLEVEQPAELVVARARRARVRAGRRSRRGRCAPRPRGGSPGGSAGSCAA